MIEAVENHMPEVIVIDEIGTELEAVAARTIAERGVQLVGTAHGNTLDNLMLNPTLCDLIGGIQAVTLGDEEARRRGTQKTVLERKAPPTFDVVVEIVERDRVIVHRSVAETVDAILRGHMVPPESRWRDEAGEVRAATKYDYRIRRERPQQLAVRDTGTGWARHLQPAHRVVGAGAPARWSWPRPGPTSRTRAAQSRRRSWRRSCPKPNTEREPAQRRTRSESALRPMALFPYGVSRKRLEQAVHELSVPVTMARDLDDADAVVTLRTYYRRKPPPCATRRRVAPRCSCSKRTP